MSAAPLEDFITSDAEKNMYRDILEFRNQCNESKVNLSERQITRLKKMITRGFGYQEIADEYGISKYELRKYVKADEKLKQKYKGAEDARMKHREAKRKKTKIANQKLIGKSIAQIRVRLNLSKAVFAKKVGVSGYTAVNQWEHGKYKPSNKILERIAKLGNTTVEKIKEGVAQ